MGRLDRSPPVFTRANSPMLKPSWMRTSRRSMMYGISTSAVELTHVSKHGFGLLLGNEALLLPFAQFP
jgi:hypothetical protein